MTTTTSGVAAVTKARSLAESTVILNLQYGEVSNRKKLDAEDWTVKPVDGKKKDEEVDSNVLHLSVDLFDSQEMRACKAFLHTLKARILEKCVPSFMRGGMYMVKLEAVDEVDRMLEQAVVDFEPLVKAFSSVVDAEKENSKVRLGPAFKDSYFPTPNEVLDAFKIEWSWFAMVTPSSLKKISIDFFEREKQKAEVSLQGAVDSVTTLLAAEVKKLADHMVDRLTPDADGKPKVFKKNSIVNLNEFLANFDLRNMGDSTELNAQVDRVRKLIEGVDADSLRKSDQLRADVAGGFKKVAEQLDLLIMKPTRKINFNREG